MSSLIFATCVRNLPLYENIVQHRIRGNVGQPFISGMWHRALARSKKQKSYSPRAAGSRGNGMKAKRQTPQWSWLKPLATMGEAPLSCLPNFSVAGCKNGSQLRAFDFRTESSTCQRGTWVQHRDTWSRTSVSCRTFSRWTHRWWWPCDGLWWPHGLHLLVLAFWGSDRWDWAV